MTIHTLATGAETLQLCLEIITIPQLLEKRNGYTLHQYNQNFENFS